MRIQHIAILLFLALLGGCVSSPIVSGDYTNQTKVNYPEANVVVEMGLGERLVAKGVRTEGDAIEVLSSTQFNKKEGEASIMTCAISVNPTTVFKRGVYPIDGGYADCFGPVTHALTLSDGNTNWNCPGQVALGDICFKENGDIFYAILNGMFPLEKDHANIRRTMKSIEHQINFVQEFIYNGRIGDHLKFVYREFSSDMIRPAFSQEVQYDFAESDIVGFKDLRLEILEANNTSIKYQLLSNFSD